MELNNYQIPELLIGKSLPDEEWNKAINHGQYLPTVAIHVGSKVQNIENGKIGEVIGVGFEPGGARYKEMCTVKYPGEPGEKYLFFEDPHWSNLYPDYRKQVIVIEF